MADLIPRQRPPLRWGAGHGHVKATVEEACAKAAERLTEAVFTALDQQPVVVVVTGAAGIVVLKLAEHLLALCRQRDQIGTQIEASCGGPASYEVLTSMPGIAA